jgi:hypothetical protein
MAEEKRLNWIAVVMLLIGALLSSFTGWFSNKQQASTQIKVTEVQQAYQMKQLLFSTRIAALKAYGASIGKSNTAVVLSLMGLHTSLSNAKSSKDAAIRAFKDYDKAIRELVNWKREVGEEAVAIEMLFNAKQPQIESLKVDIPDLGEDNLNKLADEKERDRAISQIQRNEEIMRAHVNKIASELRAHLEKVSKIFRDDNP